MGAFKQFTTKDVTITPFNASKGFNYSGSSITGSDVSINIYYGKNVPYNDPSDLETGFVFTQSNSNAYNSAKQLFYTNFLTQSTGDNVTTASLVPGALQNGVLNSADSRFIGPINCPRFENYLQSSLTQSRFLETSSYPTDTLNPDDAGTLTTISIPHKLYGEQIVPSTFEFTYTDTGGTYSDVLITDDGEGNLISSSINPTTDLVVGQIFYAQGLAVITTGSNAPSGTATKLNDIGYYTGTTGAADINNVNIKFSSSFTIYEQQFKCTILENEFGFSTNPSILKNNGISGSINVEVKDFATSSYFDPYVTCVGLYNENTQLVAVGKLSFPLPISQFTDTTIVVNFDS